MVTAEDTYNNVATNFDQTLTVDISGGPIRLWVTGNMSQGAKTFAVNFGGSGGVVIIGTDEASYVARAAGLWSDYVDNVARMRPRHAPLIKYPKGRAESGADGW